MNGTTEDTNHVFDVAHCSEYGIWRGYSNLCFDHAHLINIAKF